VTNTNRPLFKISLRPKRMMMLQTIPDYHVILTTDDGERNTGDCYYNMTGYRVGVPYLDGGRERFLDPGEISMAKLKREIANSHREARAQGYRTT
jgi:hypothetical protein